MAGLGSRFKDAGFTAPKPFINILGKSMIHRMLEVFHGDIEYKFIVRKEMYEDFRDQLSDISQDVPGLNRRSTHSLDHMTDGAACTVLTVKSSIDSYKPLLIADCDAIYNPLVLDLLDAFIKTNPAVDSISICFTNDSPKNSFVAIDHNGYTIQAAEKKVISNLCTTGMHWFKHGSIFVKAAEAMIAANDRTNNEFYITPSINHLIKMGYCHKPLLIPNSLYDQVGTPQDMLNYINKIG